MSANPTPWFSVATRSTKLQCCACRNEIDLEFPSVDHHSAFCPACGVECAFISWRDVLLQIALPKAPPELTRVVRLLQEHFDEPEFITLLVCLDQLAEAVQAGNGAAAANQPSANLVHTQPPM